MTLINLALISYGIFVDSFLRIKRQILVNLLREKDFSDSKLSDSQKLDYEFLVSNFTKNEKFRD